MSFIRSQIENRSVFMMLLIAFLCISCLSVATLVYAALPAIFGVPAVVFIKKTVAIGLGALTVWGAAEMIHKDLDEKIKALEKSIKRLTINKQTIKTAKKNAETEEKDWKKKLDTAETNVTTAQTHKETAEKAVSTAKANHKKAVYYEKWSYNSYMTHMADCRYSVGSSRCSEAQRLYDDWQANKETTKEKKAALDSAKTDLSNKSSDLSDAWETYYLFELTYREKKSLLEAAIKLQDKINASLDKKSSELVSKGIEKTINSATIINAAGQTADAMDALEAAETNYPEAWSEAMENPDLAKQVQEVRDKWNAKTGNGEQ